MKGEKIMRCKVVIPFTMACFVVKKNRFLLAGTTVNVLSVHFMKSIITKVEFNFFFHFVDIIFFVMDSLHY